MNKCLQVSQHTSQIDRPSPNFLGHYAGQMSVVFVALCLSFWPCRIKGAALLELFVCGFFHLTKFSFDPLIRLLIGHF